MAITASPGPEPSVPVLQSLWAEPMVPEVAMFQLSLVDHIRLSFGAAATSYRAHARAAARLSRACAAGSGVGDAAAGLRDRGVPARAHRSASVPDCRRRAGRRRARRPRHRAVARLRAARLRASHLRLAPLADSARSIRSLLAEVHDGLVDLARRHRAAGRPDARGPESSTNTRCPPTATRIRSPATRWAPARAPRPTRKSTACCRPRSDNQPARPPSLSDLASSDDSAGLGLRACLAQDSSRTGLEP